MTDAIVVLNAGSSRIKFSTVSMVKRPWGSICMGRSKGYTPGRVLSRRGLMDGYGKNGSGTGRASRFALTAELHDAGVCRYGFHGLSYAHVASVLPKIDPEAAEGRCVVLHPRDGASMFAVKGGRSLAGTMGFTAVDGLPMGTRCGTIYPGVILYLPDPQGMDTRAIERLIYSS